MKAWILTALLGVSLASVRPPMGVVRLQYSDPQTDDLIDLDVSINTVDDTVAFHMRGQYSMEDVDNLEDYRAGWGASKVLVDEACYLRKLNTSLNDTIDRLHELSSRGVQHMEGTLDISAIPAEDVEDWAGKRLRDFCGDYTMYQLVVSEGEETDNMKAWILAALLGVSLASVLPPMGVVRLQYSDPQTDDLIDLDVSINTVDDTVAFHMRGQYSMEDVDNLEDYRAGWGASKVLVDEACYLRKLNTSLNDTIGRLHELSSRGVQHMEGTLDISAIPAEDVEDWAGKRLRDFCGDYTMYQLVVSEGEETVVPNFSDKAFI
ncbi:putative BRICHOS domain-containing protein 2, partial [Homarus americanus]